MADVGTKEREINLCFQLLDFKGDLNERWLQQSRLTFCKTSFCSTIKLPLEWPVVCGAVHLVQRQNRVKVGTDKTRIRKLSLKMNAKVSKIKVLAIWPQGGSPQWPLKRPEFFIHIF
jgi:hypothetical protein